MKRTILQAVILLAVIVMVCLPAKKSNGQQIKETLQQIEGTYLKLSSEILDLEERLNETKKKREQWSGRVFERRIADKEISRLKKEIKDLSKKEEEPKDK